MSDQNNVQDSMHYKDCRSGMLTNGIERAAHRTLLYSTGLEERDLHKPLIAIVNSFTEMVPGHFHLRELAQCVAQGVWRPAAYRGNSPPLPFAMASARGTRA